MISWLYRLKGLTLSENTEAYEYDVYLAKGSMGALYLELRTDSYECTDTDKLT